MREPLIKWSAVFAVAAIICACSGYGGPQTISLRAPHARIERARPAALALAWDVKESSDTQPILEAAVQPGDYISTLIGRAQPDLVTRVGGWNHVVGTWNTIATGLTPPPASAQFALSRCPTGQLQFYDGEHWGRTPKTEQHDPAGAILSGAQQAQAAAPCVRSGFAAYSYGTTPDGIFEGWNSCSYNPLSAGAFFNETAAETKPIGGTNWITAGVPNSWQSVNYYNTQAQTLLSQTPWDLCYGSISFWWSAVSDRFNAAGTANPLINLWTELSFGNEDYRQIVAAITYSEQQKAAGSTGPSAYVIEYPITPTPRPSCPDPYSPPTPPPHSWATRCTFAYPAQLLAFVQAEGRPTPAPTPTPTPSPSPSPT